MKIPLLRRLFNRIDSIEWLNETTKRKNFILPYILITVGLAGSLAVFTAQVSERNNTQDYNTQVNTYVIDAFVYNSCIIRSTTRDDLRSGISTIFDFLDTLAVSSDLEQIQTEVQAAKTDFLNNYDAIPLDMCGSAPEPPPGILVIPGMDGVTTTLEAPS